VPPPLRVLLIEDNEVYRSTLELLLAQEEGIVVVAGVGDVGSAASHLEDVPPDVVVLDLRLPGLAGADAVAALLATAPTTRVLCLTAEATPALATAARAAGAVGVIEKDLPTREVADAIRSAARA
jgi:DNA-binding NarL/FixJ family response regulator